MESKSAKLKFFTILLIILFSCNKAENQNTFLYLNPANIEIGSEGGMASFSVASNSKWQVTNNSVWCRETAKSTDGNGKVDLIIEPNIETENRTATITVSTSETKKDVIVTQKGTSINQPTDTSNFGMRSFTPAELLAEMKLGWNLGNTLEAIGGETAWGNPLTTKALIDSVKAAGFNNVRIPVAWSKFSNPTNYTIDAQWMDRVEEVVNYVLDAGMYAMINIHWDNGWMQPTYQQQDYVNNRLRAMWEQIASRFSEYGPKLLFAGTNEVMVEGDYSTPKHEYYTVQNSFNQTFVSTVRETGGKNLYRYLIVQGFNTNIDHTVNFAVMPTDVIENRLVMEVHYYDPYNFALNEKSMLWQWGKIATDPSKTETWANETWVDNQFMKMKTKYIDNNIPVIMGEYGAIARTTIPEHPKFREYYLRYVTESMIKHGIIPVYWDNGYTGNHGFGLFDRHTGKQAYPEMIKAITESFN
jgi:endoglucanase